MPELTPEQQAALVAWVDQQAAGRAQILDGVTQFVLRLLRNLFGQGFYDQAAVNRVAVQISAQVRAGQVATADLTAAYLDQVLTVMEVDPPHERVQLPDQPRGIDPMREWQRPAAEYRRLRVVGLDEFEAQERALARAESLIEDDLGLAMREAARQRLTVVPDVIGYRRIIHPELSKSGTCGLCIAAADRKYGRGDLLPLHGRCKCEVLPIVKGKGDPGRTLNRQELDDLYARAGGTDRQALAKVRVKVEQHGELGPVLREKGQAFRTPKQAAKAARTYDGEIAALEKSYADLLRRQKAGEDVTGPLTYQRERLIVLRRERDAQAAA